MIRQEHNAALIRDRAFPEVRFGGFTRVNGTVEFYVRVNAILEQSGAGAAVVLDIGCGRGVPANGFVASMRKFKGRTAHVLGIDGDAVARSNPQLDEFRLIEAARWPVEDASIDVAIADFVLEHVEDPAQFFAEMARVLRPGGYLCVRTPNALSYQGLATRIVPNRWHHAAVSRVAGGYREEEDTFPTLFRCNTRRKIGAAYSAAGFEAAVYGSSPEPGYLAFSRISYALGRLYGAIAPDAARTILLGFGCRR